jgi:hypothetical protein
MWIFRAAFRGDSRSRFLAALGLTSQGGWRGRSCSASASRFLAVLGMTNYSTLVIPTRRGGICWSLYTGDHARPRPPVLRVYPGESLSTDLRWDDQRHYGESRETSAISGRCLYGAISDLSPCVLRRDEVCAECDRPGDADQGLDPGEEGRVDRAKQPDMGGYCRWMVWRRGQATSRFLGCASE